MRIKTGQRMYRIRGPDGFWIQKGEMTKLQWVANEDHATFWKKLGHLKSSRTDGVLRDELLEPFLDGLPVAALQVVEYVVTVEKTGRKNRLTDVDRFYEKEEPDGPPDV